MVPDFAEAELDLRVTKMSDREPLFARLEALARDLDPGIFQDSEWRALLTYLRGD